MIRRALLGGGLALGVLLLAAPGCGYTVGVDGRHIAGVRTVRLELVNNQTNRLDAELWLTQVLGPELAAVGYTPVLGGADAVLHVRLTDAVERTVSADELDVPAEGTLTVVADVVLKRADGTVLVDRRGIRETDTYINTRGEDESSALRGALQTLARRIADSLQSDF